jgi:hypothetical protein
VTAPSDEDEAVETALRDPDSGGESGNGESEGSGEQSTDWATVALGVLFVAFVVVRFVQPSRRGR